MTTLRPLLVHNIALNSERRHSCHGDAVLNNKVIDFVIRVSSHLRTTRPVGVFAPTARIPDSRERGKETTFFLVPLADYYSYSDTAEL